MGRRPANYRKITRVVLRGEDGAAMLELSLKYHGRKVTTKLVNLTEGGQTRPTVTSAQPVQFPGVVVDGEQPSDSEDYVSLNPLQNVMAALQAEELNLITGLSRMKET